MKALIDFIVKNRKGTGISAPIASGVAASQGAGHCDCDCYECAGGDTTDDR